jgi:hypothetical protein
MEFLLMPHGDGRRWQQATEAERRQPSMIVEVRAAVQP